MTPTTTQTSADTLLWRLAETLAVEYAGAVSAQKVARSVSKAARTMRHLNLSDSIFWELTEQNARRDLTNLLACTRREAD